MSGSVSTSASLYSFSSALELNTGSIEDNKPDYFIFIDYLLVGSYKNGQWFSSYDRDIYIADLLEEEAYYGYSQNELIGVSDELTFCYSEDLGNSFQQNPQPLIPYATEHDSGGEYITFDLPFTLPKDLRYLKSETYNTNIYFHIQNPLGEHYYTPLIISADFNPLPKTEVKELSESFSDEDKAAVTKELERLDIPGAPVNITEVYEYDVEGDGETEQFIFAQTPRTDDGYPYVSAEEIENDQSGYYYVVLCKDETSYKTVVSWSWLYRFSHNKDMTEPGDYYCTAIQSIYMEGIFDLNNDGIYELCLFQPEYEFGQVFVYTLNEHNEWDRVLAGNYGM